ncbi:hypothetical protein QYE77_10850 [Thermanaerothrix sp. 4228-RoL]|uniref:Uncharacterized protein n=1 Tax=Thermanaerothrix solaris TaxID=3058434 RepID=A0ABU3NQW3_9CHLR|nr:hypothetical protein [Thermanaerothrix sp. 4228-RoL]MDT8898765.1 hypothetical protein [Thermanaerothrix sp. 4228-RoL]
MRTKPLMLLTCLLLLLLGGTGVAYALWSEVLTVEGTVYTGEVYGKWTSCICTDEGLDPFPPTWPYPYPKPQQKDVGSTACSIDAKDPRILHLTISNGYPSYWGNCEVHFANTGSVPVVIAGYKVIAKNFTPASGNGTEDGEIWVKYWDGVGTQMEPCPDDSCEQASSLQFHVEQPAEENETYIFQVLVCLRQWNEDADLEQCLAAAPSY